MRKYSVLLLLILILPLVYSVPPTSASLTISGATEYEMDFPQFIEVKHTTDDVTDYTNDSLHCHAFIYKTAEPTKVLFRFFDRTDVCVSPFCTSPETVSYTLNMDANLTRAYNFTLTSPPFKVGEQYTIMTNCTDFELNTTYADTHDFNVVAGYGLNDWALAGITWGTQEDNVAPLLYLGIMWGLPIFCIGGIAYALWRVLLFRR